MSDINGLNMFFRHNIKQHNIKAEKDVDEKLKSENQNTDNNNRTDLNEEIAERGSDLFDSMEYIAMRGRSVVKRTSKQTPRISSARKSSGNSRRSSLEASAPHTLSSLQTQRSMNINGVLAAKTKKEQVTNIGGSFYHGDEIANGLVGDRYYEYGQLANGQVDDVIYEDGIACSDISQTSIENIQKQIKSAFSADDNFKAFIESEYEETTYTNTLSFNIGEKVGSADVTIDKEGNVLAVQDGLLITYSEENPEEIQNKEIFDIDENDIWNYTKENYGLDFAGNYSLLYSWSATNEVKSSSSINAEGADETATIAGTGSTKETTSTNPVSTSVNSQSVSKDKVISITEVENFVNDGAQALQNTSEKTKNNYQKAQAEKITNLTQEGEDFAKKALDEIDIEEITKKLTTFTYSKEDIDKQKEKVDALENAINNYNHETNNPTNIGSLEIEYCTEIDKYNEMGMYYSFEEELIAGYNNKTQNFERNVTVGNKFITYKREIQDDKKITETYLVKYDDTEITLATLNGENNNIIVKVGNENSKSKTELRKNLKVDNKYLYYKYSDENVTKEICVTEKSTTVTILTNNNGNQVKTYIMKGKDEDDRTHDVYMITENDKKIGFLEISSDKTKRSCYAKVLPNGEIVKNYYYCNEIFLEDGSYLLDIKNKEEDYDTSLFVKRDQKLEIYRIKENINNTSDKKYMGKNVTLFNETDEAGNILINSEITMSAFELDSSCNKSIKEYVLGEDNDGYKNYIATDFYEEIRVFTEEEEEIDDEGNKRYNSKEQYHKKVSIYEVNKTAGEILGSRFKESIAEWTIEGEPSGKTIIKSEGSKKRRQVISSDGKVVLETIQDTSLDNKQDGIVYNICQGGIGDCWLLTVLWWLGTLGIDLTKPYGDAKPVINWNKDGSCTVNLYDIRQKNNNINQQTYTITKKELDNPIYLDEDKTVELCTGDKTAKAIEISILKLGGLNLINGGTTTKLFQLLFGEKSGIWEKNNFTNPTIEDLQNAAELSLTEDELKSSGLKIEEIISNDGVYKAGLIKDINGNYVPAIIANHSLAIEPNSINNPPGYITIRNPWNNGETIYTIPLDWVMNNMRVDGVTSRLKPEVLAKLNKMKTVVQYQKEMENASREEHPTLATILY